MTALPVLDRPVVRRSAPVVRAATPADVPALLRMGRAMHAESAYAFVPFDDVKVEALAVAVIGGKGYAAVAHDRGGEPWAMIAGRATEYWFSRARLAVDLCWYVDPARRRTWGAMRALPLMVDGFKRWADAQGCYEVSMGASAGDIDAAGKLIERMGFRRAGLVYKARLR